jgi:hypothetical protein
MSRDRAERLVLYLQDAVGTLERASRAASGFAKEERLRFGGLIRELIEDLEADILSPLYDKYPDFRPEHVERETQPSAASYAGMRCALSPRFLRRTSMTFCFHC